MGNDERHMALPKLYGAPAYARPTVIPVAPVERPFDPDDLPLEAERTIEDGEHQDQVAARAYAGGVTGEPVGVGAGGAREGSPMLRGRPFRLGTITSRFRGDDGSNA